MLTKLTEHFAVITAVVTLTASLITMTFVYAYLSPFDSRLIWLIEYSDVIKFCLIGVAILSSIVAAISAYFEDFTRWMENIQRKGWFTAGIVILLCLILALELYSDFYVTKSPAKEYHIFKFLTVVSLIALYLGIAQSYKDYKAISGPVTWNISVLVNGIFFVLLVIGFLGRTVGLRVRDVAVQSHTITFSDESKITEVTGAKIIMVTSQYTIFQNRDGLMAVPSSVVMKIKTNPIIYVRRSGGGGK